MRYVGPRHIVIDDHPVIPEYWLPDRSFEGMTVAVIGSGPSLAALDLERLRGQRFIAINSGCRKVRPVATKDDPLYFTDNAWSENRAELVRDWPGPVLTSNRHAKVRLGNAVKYFDVLALTERFATRQDYVQASSGHIAACLAAVMGAVRIVLVGMDCCAVDGQTHGHSDYNQHDLMVFTERFLPAWRALAPIFAGMNVEVVNTSPTSAVKEFPFVEFGAWV